METTERWVRREVRAMTRREVITKAIPGQYPREKGNDPAYALQQTRTCAQQTDLPGGRSESVAVRQMAI
jgi:hypothetical protein